MTHTISLDVVVSQASLDDMTDLKKRPEYGLGIFDRRYQYGAASGALGHTGFVHEGGRTAALCFQDPAMVVLVLANTEHDVETTAGNLWRAASKRVVRPMLLPDRGTAITGPPPPRHGAGRSPLSRRSRITSLPF